MRLAKLTKKNRMHNNRELLKNESEKKFEKVKRINDLKKTSVLQN